MFGGNDDIAKKHEAVRLMLEEYFT